MNYSLYSLQIYTPSKMEKGAHYFLFWMLYMHLLRQGGVHINKLALIVKKTYKYEKIAIFSFGFDKSDWIWTSVE
ncbi:MAG: hypothetical protein CVU14_12670, partial [Bacteroidetes bacterium HGW-Bacteroidetes-9]